MKKNLLLLSILALLASCSSDYFSNLANSTWTHDQPGVELLLKFHEGNKMSVLYEENNIVKYTWVGTYTQTSKNKGTISVVSCEYFPNETYEIKLVGNNVIRTNPETWDFKHLR